MYNWLRMHYHATSGQLTEVKGAFVA